MDNRRGLRAGRGSLSLKCPSGVSDRLLRWITLRGGATWGRWILVLIPPAADLASVWMGDSEVPQCCILAS
jgi:hypothetical protein